jgi:MFS family permease
MSKPSTESLEPMLAAEKRTVGIVAVVAMFRMFGLFALLPVLSIYAADLRGATPLLIGLAVGAYGLTQAALQVPLGALSDRVGRVPVVVTGLAIFAAGSLIAALSDSVHGVIAGRFLQGAGAISSTLTALLADATRPAVRTRTMAIYGVGVGASILLALVFGPIIAGGGGVQALFFATAVMAGVAAAMLSLLPPRPARIAPPERPDFRDALTPPLLTLDLYIFLLHAMLTAMFVALPFVLRNRLEIPLSDHWQIYVTALLVSLVGTVPLIMADDRQGKRWTVQLALLCQLAGCLLLGFAGFAIVPVILAMALFFVGLNFLEAALPARLSLLANEHQRGASLGVFSSAQFLGAFAGGLFGGWLLSSGHPGDVFLVAAMVIAAWLVFHLAVFSALNKPDVPEM